MQTTSATSSGAFLTTNAGGLDVSGLELEITAVGNGNWDIFFAAGFQDAEYTDLPAGCMPINEDFAAFDANCNVADPKRSPDTTFTLGTTYDFPLPGMGVTLSPTIAARITDDNVTGTRQSGAKEAEATINAGITLADDDGIWSATLECNNCSDEEYTTSFLFVPYYSQPMT